MQSFPVVRRHLRDQLIRAADSAVLNIAEGSGLERDGARHHFRIALGSAAEHLRCSIWPTCRAAQIGSGSSSAWARCSGGSPAPIVKSLFGNVVLVRARGRGRDQVHAKKRKCRWLSTRRTPCPPGRDRSRMPEIGSFRARRSVVPWYDSPSDAILLLLLASAAMASSFLEDGQPPVHPAVEADLIVVGVVGEPSIYRDPPTYDHRNLLVDGGRPRALFPITVTEVVKGTAAATGVKVDIPPGTNELIWGGNTVFLHLERYSRHPEHFTPIAPTAVYVRRETASCGAVVLGIGDTMLVSYPTSLTELPLLGGPSEDKLVYVDGRARMLALTEAELCTALPWDALLGNARAALVLGAP